MFDYLSGFIADKKHTIKGYFVTIDINGIGYLFETINNDFSLCKIGDNCKFYVVLIHREDNMALYGFLNRESRDIFQMLISVSGVGVKMALALLNQFNISDLISFVINGDYKELTLAKGVGTKLAQKIILELKDKLTKAEVCVNVQKSNNTDNQTLLEVKTILLSLGYKEDEIDNVLSDIPQTVSCAEEIIRKALLKLSATM